MRKLKYVLSVVVIGYIIWCNTTVKVGDTMWSDKGDYYFYNGKEWIEIINKDHHNELIEEYLK